MSLLKLSCKKATEMVEQDEIILLSFVDKVKLKIHLSVCKACRNYQKQSKLIDDFFSNTSESDLDNIPVEENLKLKEIILKNLDENQP